MSLSTASSVVVPLTEQAVSENINAALTAIPVISFFIFISLNREML
jgi:hypothetical protein